MKIPKWALISVAVVLVLSVGLGFHFYMKGKIDTAVALERAKAAEAQVAVLNGQISVQNGIILEANEALAKSQQDALRREREFQKILAGVQVATPIQLVDQGSAILKVSDIVTDGRNVTMGVETYRKVVFILVEHEEYVKVKEPRWVADSANYQRQISGYKANEISYEKREVINISIIKDLRDALSHQKATSLFQKLAWGAAGAGLGMLADKLIK